MDIGHIMGCRGSVFWDWTGLLMGCLGEESEAKKRRDLGDLGRNKSGKGTVVCEKFAGCLSAMPCTCSAQPVPILLHSFITLYE